MKNLFVYGSLMYDEVWNQIVLGCHEKIKAEIVGYKRLKIKNANYPGLVKGTGTVQGFVWLNVSQSNIKKLDLFEGEYYKRVEDIATDINNKKIIVNFYLIQDLYLSILEDIEWDENEFQKNGLDNFLKKYVGFKEKVEEL